MGKLYACAALAAVVACGDDGGGAQPDAASPDGSGSGSGTVRVRVTKELSNEPDAGVRVYVQRADSSVIASTTTDATGLATAEVEPDSLVTVIPKYDFTLGTPVLTYANVQPGDELVVNGPGTGTALSFRLTFPTDPGATHYELFLSCRDEAVYLDNSNAGGIDITAHRCAAPVDVALLSQGGPDGPKYLTAAQQTPGTELALTGPFAAFPTTTTVDIVNLPTDYQPYRATLDIINPQMYRLRRLVQLEGATSVVLGVPAIAGTVRAEVAIDGFGDNRHYLTRHQPVAAMSAFDASIVLPEFTAAPAWDKASQTLTLAKSATGATPGLQFTMILAGRGDKTWTRSYVGKPTDTITLPRLPVDDYDYNVDPAETGGGVIELFQASTSYDAVRESFYAVTDPYQAAVPADGTTSALVEYLR